MAYIPAADKIIRIWILKALKDEGITYRKSEAVFKRIEDSARKGGWCWQIKRMN